jgi:C4-dicarboxylate transporter
MNLVCALPIPRRVESLGLSVVALHHLSAFMNAIDFNHGMVKLWVGPLI